MTYNEVLAYIQSEIVANGNQEITANVLRPVLESILAQIPETTGLLTDLATTDKTNLVAAINEVLGLINNDSGITVLSGTQNPNTTPPIGYSIGDMYSQINGSNNPIGFYIYNGSKWFDLWNVFSIITSVTTIHFEDYFVVTPLSVATAFNNGDIGNLIVQPYTSPVVLRLIETLADSVKLYTYLFTGGAGRWGENYLFINQTKLIEISVKPLSISEIPSDINTVTTDLGTLTTNDYITALNAVERDFSDESKVYYVTYNILEDDILVVKSFKLLTEYYGVYGGTTGNDLTESMFVTGATSETPDYIVPTFQQVVEQGSSATTNEDFILSHGSGESYSNLSLEDGSVVLGTTGNNLKITDDTAVFLSPVTVGEPLSDNDAVRVLDLEAFGLNQDLDKITTNGNSTPNGIGVGTIQSSMPSDVGLLRVGDGDNTDTYSTSAFSELRTVSVGVWNMINAELRAIIAANMSERMRGIKGVSIVDTAGFTLSNVGGGALGVEGVSRSIGTLGTILVATGLYGRVLIDGSANITNAVGLYIPVHAKGSGIITNAIGGAFNEQTLGVNNFNILMGTSLASGGQAPTGITGNWNIYNISTRPNYFAGNIVYATYTPSGYDDNTLVPKKFVTDAIAAIPGTTVPDATDMVKGILKLYNALGTNLDGSITQDAINTALGLKVNKNGDTMLGTLRTLNMLPDISNTSVVGSDTLRYLSSRITTMYALVIQTISNSNMLFRDFSGATKGTMFTSGRWGFGTTTDNGTDVIQANGTISALPATASTQVVVKSQLDVLLTGQTITGNPTGTILPNTKYITDAGTRLTIPLPLNANSSVGNFIEIRGKGLGGWKLSQPEAATIIHAATDTTTGTTGYIQSSNRYDTIRVEKLAANEWILTQITGTPSIF